MDPYIQETGGRYQAMYEDSARQGRARDREDRDPLDPLDQLDREEMVRVENFYEYDATV